MVAVVDRKQDRPGVGGYAAAAEESRMKHKIAELEGALLDAAVAKAEGEAFSIGRDPDADFVPVPPGDICRRHPEDGGLFCYSPSTSWTEGGPIIERERISVEAQDGGAKGWRAHTSREGFVKALSNGLTPLIAAMRCYVASKFGEEVELP